MLVNQQVYDLNIGGMRLETFFGDCEANQKNPIRHMPITITRYCECPHCETIQQCQFVSNMGIMLAICADCGQSIEWLLGF